MNIIFANGYFFLRVIKNKYPECVTASSRFSLVGLKSQPTRSCEKNRQHLFCVQICLYSFVSCSGDEML